MHVHVQGVYEPSVRNYGEREGGRVKEMGLERGSERSSEYAF